MRNKGCQSCKQYREEIEELKEEMAFIKFELEQLRQKKFKPKNKKKPAKDNEPRVSKKKGGLFGHLGWFRKKPKKINRIEEVRLDKCADCGGQHLKECGDIEEHIQEDIILPVVETVLFKRHHYYCYGCKKGSQW